MNFNRLVKRYHIEEGELTVPSDSEVQERKLERVVTRLADEGQTLPLDDFIELGPIARKIATHEHRDRMVALLLRNYFQAPLPEAEEEEEPPPPRPDGQGRSGGYRRRRR